MIKTERHTRSGAAKLFGVTQSRITDLARGKIELFSIDGLVNMLAAAGRRAEVSVERGEHRTA
ncbi:MAG: XRE family transcriptional regulator [Gemmatimonadetes bacterium]|nr:XRE family transcriptional regulator [Gemmatimonadota bacterium]